MTAYLCRSTALMARLVLVMSCALPLGACATSMTSTTEARAYEPGEVQVAATYQVNAHTNILSSLSNNIESLDERFDGPDDQPISEEEFRQWVDLALTSAMFRPTTGPEVLIRAGVTDKIMEGIDLGFRTNFNLYKGEAKLQLWENDSGSQAFSVMGGYAHHTGLIGEALSYVTLTDFKRRDFDLQLLWGVRVGDILRVAITPHMILSRVSAEQKIPARIERRLPEEFDRYNPNQFFQDEWISYFGVNSTIMIGYKYVFAVVDSGVFWMNFKPEVIGERRDYSGAAVSLAGGLSVNYPF